MRDEADFAEFLWLMKWMLDSDFGGIGERTKEKRRLVSDIGESTRVKSKEKSGSFSENDTISRNQRGIPKFLNFSF